jgi:hypothetical protein
MPAATPSVVNVRVSVLAAEKEPDEPAATASAANLEEK